MNTKVLLYLIFTTSLFVFSLSCKQTNNPQNAETPLKTTSANDSTGQKITELNDTLKGNEAASLDKTSSINGNSTTKVEPSKDKVQASPQTPKKETATTGTNSNRQNAAKQDNSGNTVPTVTAKNKETEEKEKNAKESTITSTTPPQQTSEPNKPMYPHSPKIPTDAEQFNTFFFAVSNFLKRQVTNGLVNYSNIQKDKTEMNALVRKISLADLSGRTDIEQQAFYINAYNIIVIKSVIDHNLPTSPLNVPGFFNEAKHQVAQRSLTLDQLEKTVLFGLKKDPRFHFALVCAAKGCPPLINTAYTPQQLNAQLTQQTRIALNNNQFVKVNAKAQTVSVSKIFEWYKDDFISQNKSAIDFINQYRSQPIPSNYQLEYFPYDWDLNRQ